MKDKSSPKSDSDKPYEGYWATIQATPTTFSMQDNCGGIPREIALNSAFRLGRVETDRDVDIPTVGMYGIGMKRAIFKLGKNAVITSQHNGEAYSVEISPEWMEDDANWQLELIPISLKSSASDGTHIKVTQLHENISQQFDPNSSAFLTNLRDTISQLFALIIEKGFTVVLNEVPIEPVTLDILYSSDFAADSILPYAYQTTFMGVNVNLIVGFYREPATVEEIDDEQRIARSRDNAGWTVICNDRVVLHKDTSRITGWGDANVPKYHNQFIAIAGVVQFTTTHDTLNLPLNTTKRGLDTSSPVYWQVLPYMREGLKKFTDFTNKWKGRESETALQFKRTKLNDPIQIVREIPEEKWKSVRRDEPTARRFVPDLPLPEPTSDRRRISFVRLHSEIEFLGEFLFDNPEAVPSEVGNKCFEELLHQAKEKQ